MSKKIKLVPVELDIFNNRVEDVPTQQPVEILAPNSYELTTEMSDNIHTGYLGNTLVGERYFLDREYNFSWIGDKKEIDKIRFFLTQTSHEHFLMQGLTDSKILTPTAMFNSKAMLASIVDSFKPASSQYQTILRKYLGTKSYPTGSTGVRMSPESVDIESQFDMIPSNQIGATTYIYLEKGKEYVLGSDLNSYDNEGTDVQHLLPFNIRVYSIDRDSGGVSFSLNYDLVSPRNYQKLDLDTEHDSIMRLTTITPFKPDTTKNNSDLRGILNYSAPLIMEYTDGMEDDFVEIADTALADNYENIPSLLTPVNSGVYNMINNRIAEFSISFKEVLHVVS